jgi:hypothetical protein
VDDDDDNDDDDDVHSLHSHEEYVSVAGNVYTRVTGQVALGSS